MFYIYAHYQKDDNQLFYIGKGYGRRAYHRYNRNKYWNNIVDKHNFYVKLLYENLSEQDAYKLEEKLIEELKPKANYAKGGKGGMQGYKHSNERNEKLSKALKGRKNTWIDKLPQNQKGYKHSQEFKDKISKSLQGNQFAKGMKHSNETKRKISEKNKNNKYSLGKIHSEKTRELKRKAILGIKRSPETKEKMKQAALKRWAKEHKK